MQEHVIVALAAVAISIFSFNSGVGIYTTGSSLMKGREPVTMNLKRLDFVDGKFEQEFYITGTRTINAKWAAEIDRGSEQLCFASGEAPYQNEKLQKFPPDDWAGKFEGDCGELQSGDVAIAVWSYVTSENVLVRISGEITLD